MNKNIPLFVAGCIFSLVALGQLLRIIYKVQIVASGVVIPLEASYFGFAFALILAIWMFTASRRK